MNATPELTVGVLAYPGCFASEVFGVLDLLTIGTQVAHTHRQTPALRTIVVSPRHRITASGGVLVGVQPIQPVDVLVVPGFAFVPGEDIRTRLSTLTPEVRVVCSQVAAGRAVVSICVGAFILGAAGALDGRKATTAWLFAEDLRRQVPAARVVSDELVVTDSGVTTTAAFSAMYDFVLGLIERHHGPTVARRTARIALLDDTRTSQSPYVDERLLAPPGSSFARAVQRHIEGNLGLPYDLSRIAEHFHLSTRTFLRHYKAETGEAPLAHLRRARVRRAQHLLETTTWTLGDVQRTVGYRDSGAFTALFHRHTGLRPRDYRARFQPQTMSRSRNPDPRESISSG
jgi:transcriptional regulator GlxA family with amidase domain